MSTMDDLPEIGGRKSVYDSLLGWAHLTHSQAAGTLALVFAILIGISICMQKDPPSFAYMALLIFGLVPIALLLKRELAAMTVKTPTGDYGLLIGSQQNLVAEVAELRKDTDESLEVAAQVITSSEQKTSKEAIEQSAREEIDAHHENADIPLGSIHSQFLSNASLAVLEKVWKRRAQSSESRIPAGSRVRIFDLGSGDALAPSISLIEGRQGVVITDLVPLSDKPGFYSGSIQLTGSSAALFFSEVSAAKVISEIKWPTKPPSSS